MTDSSEGTSYQPGLKVCQTCHVAKPATSEFYSRNRSTQDGLQKACKECNAAWREAHIDTERARSTAWKKANPERKKELDRIYGEAHRETGKARSSAWRLANPDRVRELQHTWHKNNPEQSSKYGRTYREKHPLVRKANGQRRRARKLAAEGTHTAADIKAQYERQHGRCYYCGEKVGDIYHVDHVVPLSRGGSDYPDNLVIACPSCNLSKQDKLPHEWGKGGRLL